MREIRPSGSVRGAGRKVRPYRDYLIHMRSMEGPEGRWTGRERTAELRGSSSPVPKSEGPVAPTFLGRGRPGLPASAGFRRMC